MSERPESPKTEQSAASESKIDVQFDRTLAQAMKAFEIQNQKDMTAEDASQHFIFEQRDDFIRLGQSELRKFAYKNQQPSADDVMYGYAALAGYMKRPDADWTHDDPAMERAAVSARTMMLDIGNKLWPETVHRAQQSEPGLRRYMELTKIFHLGEIDKEQGKTLDKDDEALLESIDQLIERASSHLFDTAETAFNQNLMQNPGTNENLKEVAQGVYELSILRDQLAAKIQAKEALTQKAEVERQAQQDIDKTREQIATFRTEASNATEQAGLSLADAKKMAGYATSFLSQRLNQPSGTDKLHLTDSDVDRWNNLARGMEQIRREYVENTADPSNKILTRKKIDDLLARI